MTNFLNDIVGAVLFGLFLLGWFNLGQGPDWTWWKLIAYIGDIYANNI